MNSLFLVPFLCKPKILIFFISFNYNLHCAMCFSWIKQKQTKEPTLDEIRAIFNDKVLKNNLEIINITGGESTLRQFQDPETREMVIRNVYAQEEVFQGTYINDAPDLFVGFNSGYRASWQTALGGVPAVKIEDNKKKWSGDHLMDSSLVPGLIFTNRKATLNYPSIIDIAPTIFGLFDVVFSKEIQGKVLFRNEDN